VYNVVPFSISFLGNFFSFTFEGERSFIRSLHNSDTHGAEKVSLSFRNMSQLYFPDVFVFFFIII